MYYLAQQMHNQLLKKDWSMKSLNLIFQKFSMKVLSLRKIVRSQQNSRSDIQCLSLVNSSAFKILLLFIYWPSDLIFQNFIYRAPCIFLRYFRRQH
jgi:hypothetical protein